LSGAIYGTNKAHHDVIIISYENLRKNSEYLETVDFTFIVLDEAHLIKNAKSQMTLTTKSLKAKWKLILTGTPLQNRVTELWSLFDFLMPGFLEDEKTFNWKYTHYLTTSIKKIGDKPEETQNFIYSIKNLREWIAPFILRWTKANVMKELPDKIILDYSCEKSATQDVISKMLDHHFPFIADTKSNKSKSSK